MRNPKIKKANDQLEEASRRLDDAIAVLIKKRSRAERLEKENSALRKTSDIQIKRTSMQNLEVNRLTQSLYGFNVEGI